MSNNTRIQFKEQNVLNIPPSVLFAGIAVGIFYAFSLYAFFYVCREAFRLFTVTEYYDLLVLSPGQVFSYNLFFAFIATIMGQSVCFLFWFDRPRRIFGKSQRRRASIVNDQRNLLWYFMFWFTRIVWLAGFFFYFAIPYGYEAISFFPDYLPEAILIIFVLYLNNWVTFRRAFKKESRKWLLVSSLFVVGLSFLFASINLVDYRKINETVLEKNVYRTYQLNVPEVDASLIRYPQWRENSFTWQAFIVMKERDHQPSSPNIIVDNEIVTMEAYREKLTEWLSEFAGFYRNILDIRLHVDCRVPMNIIDQLHQIHYDASLYHLGYAVNPSGKDFSEDRNMYTYVFTMIQEKLNDEDSIGRIAIEKDSITNIVKVDINRNGSYSLSNIPIDKYELRKIIADEMRKDDNFLILLTLSGNTPFGEYLFAWTEMLAALNEIRNEYALVHCKKPFTQIHDYDQMTGIRLKFPFRLLHFVGD